MVSPKTPKKAPVKSPANPDIAPSGGATLKAPTEKAKPAGKGTKAKSPRKYIWWEKTVEYNYAIRNLSGYVQICPLDGPHETAGDVIASKKARWCLIEFKRVGPTEQQKNKNTLTYSENKKFKGTTLAKATLKNYVGDKKPKFHSIVFGENATEGKLAIGAHDYWRVAEGRAVGELLSESYTCDEITFFNYLKIFMKAKGNGEVPPGNSGGVDPKNGGGNPKDPKDPVGGPAILNDDKSLDFLNVIAIVSEGKEIFSAPLRDFYALLKISKSAPPPPLSGTGGGGPDDPPPHGKGDAGAANELIFEDEMNGDAVPRGTVLEEALEATLVDA
jgi:hypothetical protein